MIVWTKAVKIDHDSPPDDAYCEWLTSTAKQEFDWGSLLSPVVASKARWGDEQIQHITTRQQVLLCLRKESPCNSIFFVYWSTNILFSCQLTRSCGVLPPTSWILLLGHPQPAARLHQLPSRSPLLARWAWVTLPAQDQQWTIHAPWTSKRESSAEIGALLAWFCSRRGGGRRFIRVRWGWSRSGLEKEWGERERRVEGHKQRKEEGELGILKPLRLYGWK